MPIWDRSVKSQIPHVTASSTMYAGIWCEGIDMAHCKGALPCPAIRRSMCLTLTRPTTKYLLGAVHEHAALRVLLEPQRRAAADRHRVLSQQVEDRLVVDLRVAQRIVSEVTVADVQHRLSMHLSVTRKVPTIYWHLPRSC